MKKIKEFNDVAFCTPVWEVGVLSAVEGHVIKLIIRLSTRVSRALDKVFNREIGRFAPQSSGFRLGLSRGTM